MLRRSVGARLSALRSGGRFAWSRRRVEPGPGPVAILEKNFSRTSRGDKVDLLIEHGAADDVKLGLETLIQDLERLDVDAMNCTRRKSMPISRISARRRRGVFRAVGSPRTSGGCAKIHRSGYVRALHSSVPAANPRPAHGAFEFDPQALGMIVGSLLDAFLDDRVSPFGILTAIDTFVNESLTNLFRVLHQGRVEVCAPRASFCS